MIVKTIEEELKSLPYHGRGILIGKTPDGKKAVTAYFIMGRSENSRNRVFVNDGEGIRTMAFDESKMSDPHLIIYAPVRVLGDKVIVTNGDQTDTIYDNMEKGQTFEQSLLSREFEDDAPTYTPRISGIMDFSGEFKYTLSILKSADGDSASCERFTFDYSNPINGYGHFIHTYKSSDKTLVSFEGEPKKLIIPDADIDEFTKTVWNNLNEDNKVSLFVRFIDIGSGEYESRIVNKNK